MRRVVLAAAAMSVLVACQQERTSPADAETTATQAPADAASASAGRTAESSAAAPAATDSAAPPSPVTARPDGTQVVEAPNAPDAPELAYAYEYAVEAPEERVAGLMRRHERACVLAGPRICQLLGAETRIDEDSGKTGGELRLRAVPVWIEEFRDQLDEDAADIDGRVLSASAATDDLTRQLGDQQAHVVRLEAERERLTRQLRAYRGSIEGRLELERELESVNADLGAGTRDLRGSEAQITMATLQVRYQAEGAAATRGDFAPLSRAASSFTGTVMQALAAVVTIASVLLVPALVVGGIWGAIRFSRRRRRLATPLPVAGEGGARAR